MLEIIVSHLVFGISVTLGVLLVRALRRRLRITGEINVKLSLGDLPPPQIKGGS